ncbi:MAG TPA: GNAT family N-acetyltransferase [bacterium]|nr:GNAT family N-acetyltransferase [bacterium]
MNVLVRPATRETVQLPLVVGGRASAPAEWEAWAEEPGVDLVAHEDGRVVGGVHVSMVSRTEAWLEGLRVHPEAQGRGIAAQLVKGAEGVARHYGASVARTAVPAHEYAAQAVAERVGYRSVLRCSVVRAPLPSGPARMPYDAPLEVPVAAHSAEILRVLESTTALVAWQHLVPLGWRFRRLVPELVTGLVKDRRVLTALQPGARRSVLQAAAFYAWHDEDVVISLSWGSPSGLQAVFGALTEEARGRGTSHVVMFTPDVRSLESLDVREWTPHTWCPEGLSVVEKNLAT